MGEILIGTAMIINALVAVYGLVVAHNNAGTIQKLEVNTNNKFEKLLKVTAEAEHAKGVIQGEQSK